MDAWTEKTRKKVAKLLASEPLTKIARLRGLLDMLVQARENGHSMESLRVLLAGEGLEFPSHSAFCRAYERAKKAGPLSRDLHVEKSSQSAVVVAPVKAETAPKTTPVVGSGQRTSGGVRVVKSGSQEPELSKNPKLEDFI